MWKETKIFFMWQRTGNTMNVWALNILCVSGDQAPCGELWAVQHLLRLSGIRRPSLWVVCPLQQVSKKPSPTPVCVTSHVLSAGVFHLSQSRQKRDYETRVSLTETRTGTTENFQFALLLATPVVFPFQYQPWWKYVDEIELSFYCLVWQQLNADLHWGW